MCKCGSGKESRFIGIGQLSEQKGAVLEHEHVEALLSVRGFRFAVVVRILGVGLV